jgi:hypothetical protein
MEQENSTKDIGTDTGTIAEVNEGSKGKMAGLGSSKRKGRR